MVPQATLRGIAFASSKTLGQTQIFHLQLRCCADPVNHRTIIQENVEQLQQQQQRCRWVNWILLVCRVLRNVYLLYCAYVSCDPDREPLHCPTHATMLGMLLLCGLGVLSC